MLKPVEMCKVNILALEKHAAALTRLLGARELIHLVDATAQSPGRLLAPFWNFDSQKLHQAADQCATLMRQLDAHGRQEDSKLLTLDEITERLNDIGKRHEEADNAVTALVAEVNDVSLKLAHLGESSSEKKPLEEQKAELEKRLADSREALKRLTDEEGPNLQMINGRLEDLALLEGVKGKYGRLKHLACISGWIPKAEEENVKAIVAEATGGTGVVEVVPAMMDARVRTGEEKVPTEMRGNAFTRPFQMLVTNFGIPSYNEIDPTLFFGISFVLMFGYMFGDIGQGLVLVLAGLWAKFTRRKLDDFIRDAGMLLVMCGVCAMLFGVAYGSVFGYEHLFESVWVNPMKSADVPALLLTAVGIGTVFTSIAIIFNIINHIRARKVFDGTVERFGIVGLLFFWFCLALGAWLMTGHEFSTWMVVPLALPLVILFIREPLHNVLHHHGVFAGGVIGVFLECCIGVMETLTGYFSSTVSFVRVGAFAISHAALCFAVFTLAGMMNDIPFGGAVKILIIILGNILVIGFEGMVAMVQCVRLEYYELFGKYFGGEGIPYKPFSLKKED